MDDAAATVCARVRSAMLVGELASAREQLESALSSPPGSPLGPEARLQVLELRARLAVLTGEGDGLVAQLEQHVRDSERDHAAAAGRLLLEVVLLKLYAAHPDSVRTAERARELTADDGPATRARADTVLGLAHAFAGEHEEAERHLSRGADLARVGGAPDDVAFLLQQVVVALSAGERYAEALAVARRYLRAVRAVGAEGMLPTVLCFLANAAYFNGDLDQMEIAAAEAVHLASASGQPGLAAYGKACGALVAALRGVASGPAELEQSVHELAANGAERIQTLPLMGLGLVALARGDAEESVRWYAALREFMSHSPTVPGLLHWRADEVEALWRAGRTEAARVALAELLDGVDAHGAWERAGAARARGMLTEDDAAAEAAFHEALRLHGESSSAIERARTELCLGEWLADRGRADEARVHLQSAAETFAEIDVVGWRDAATRCMAALGPPSEASVRAPGLGAASSVPPTPQGSTGPVRLRAFGPLTVVRDGTESRVGLDTPGRLLHSLVASGGALHAEQAIDSLWPDGSPSAGASRLRTVLARVRKAHGPIVVREGAVLRWAEGVEVDVDRFLELARRATALRSGKEAATAAREAVLLYGPGLLPLDRYGADVATTREQLRRRHLTLLDLLAEQALAEGDPDGAAEHLRAAIDTEPLDEARYARLTALLLDQGRLGQAQAVLASAIRTMSDLGLSVSPRLAELRRRLEG